MTFSYIIRPLENGYIVEHSYKVPATKEYDGWTYKKYVYADWAGVVEWIGSNPIAIPQAD